jgi:transposase
MLSFSGSLRIYVAVEPCDMRMGFNGLQGAVAEKLKGNVRDGALFVFTNKRRTRLKVLYFDGSGLWLLTKRLDRGHFSWPRHVDGQAARIMLAPEAFAMLTDGIDMNQATMRPWYDRE